MARAKRHFIPGYIWHITHRCHKREFLLKFARDRRRWLYWLYQARKRYCLTFLNYTVVTSNNNNEWIEEYLGSQETGRDDKWTRSIAVGSKGFVEKVRSILFGLVKGRKVKESGDGYQLREPSAPYRVDFEAENEDIGLENTHFWKSFAD